MPSIIYQSFANKPIMLSVAMESAIKLNVEASFQITPTLYILDTKTKPWASSHFTRLIVVVQNVKLEQVTRLFNKICPIFQKVAKTDSKPKNCQIIYIKSQLESPKCLHQTTFETLKYLQKPCFETTYLDENVINLLEQKVA
jgi:hypothetical protein